MQKVITLLGSPKIKGNTATVLSHFEKNISAEYEVGRVNIGEMDIKGCLGCYACQAREDELGCVQEDDSEAVFKKMMTADVIVYATPLYYCGFSSQIKALIDRHICLVRGYGTPHIKSFISGKLTSLLVTCAGPVGENADLIQVVFDRISDFCQLQPVGKYIVTGCTTPEEIGARGNDFAKKMAADIKEGLCGIKIE